ncbi:hypothetical protein EIP91_004639 [Steccherinum ochraceum]|uniref:Uncharacterized protein n=1 Tax=Steccherinum ochraceum TaxID=92696 RepID=A0A4R0RWD2_9APHY|nr:hypothetical protein EIP91_004639 [Steccherinum ochraceum]
MHSMQHIFAGDAVYAPPVLRAPSPSSSIGTDYGPDETSIADLEMSPEDFKLMVEAELALNQPRPEETLACAEPLLPKPAGPLAERTLFLQVMQNLRAQVKKLQEDEIFERTLYHGFNAPEEQQPTSNDIDAIMRSMMGEPATSSRVATEPPGSPLPILSPVPSNASAAGAFTIGSNSDTSTTSASKRPTKTRSKGKTKRV